MIGNQGCNKHLIVFSQSAINEHGCKVLWIIYLTTLIMSQINFLLYMYFKNGKSMKHEIFTIAKSFNETNNYVKMIAKYYVVFTAYVRI